MGKVDVDLGKISDIKTSYSDNNFVHDFFKKRPTQSRNISIDEFVEDLTVPAGKYKGAKYSIKRTPYLRKPLQYMSVQSTIQELYLMFSAQTSKTSICDISAAFYTSVLPSEIIYCAMEAGAARKWANKRYMPICRNLGVEFRTSIEDKKSRSSGNTVFAKEFDGGNIDIVSSQSSSQIASETKRIVFADEISRYKSDLNGEGSPLKLLQARCKQWGDQSKFLGISTPNIEGDLIDVNFKRGTQEHFHIECPNGCGAIFPLEWKEDGSSGFTYDTTAGKITTAYYLCPKCGNAFFEKSRSRFLQTGIWTPHNEPDDPTVASMHLNVLYSPFETWLKVAREHAKSTEDIMEGIAYTNLYKGLPYKEIGARPEASMISMKNTFKIQQGDIPNDTLYLSIGSDVQRGKEKYQTMTDEQIEKELQSFADTGKNPHNQGFPRIEILLLGTSWAWRTHAIQYKIFYGQTTDSNSGAFQKFREWFLENVNNFKRIDGSIVKCPIVLVDSGDGQGTTAVYNFCESFPGGAVHPCKGNSALVKNKKDKGDEIRISDFIRFRESKTGHSNPLITVSTNYYKSQIYSRLDIPRIDAHEQKPGFISFPSNFPDLFFKMLTSEEKWKDGSFHAKGRRNEALDIMVYANAGAEYWLSKYVEQCREHIVKSAKISRNDAKKNITTRSIIEKMRHELLKSQKKKK